jgi:hypothetical protein
LRLFSKNYSVLFLVFIAGIAFSKTIIIEWIIKLKTNSLFIIID